MMSTEMPHADGQYAEMQHAEILAVAEMYAADRFAAQHGTSSLSLMENAGRAICDEIVKRWHPCRTLVMCGPGNNGGDGFVVARRLRELGWDAHVGLTGEIGAYQGDAAANAARWTERWDGETRPLAPDLFDGCGLVVDALFGAGLSRPLDGLALRMVTELRRRRIPVVAVDVPSGLSGDLGKPLSGLCVRADLTVTFFRKKPAHVLMPGRMYCGDVAVRDIGIPAAALSGQPWRLMENLPCLWRTQFPRLDPLGHKYSRGHVLAISGPAHATGAARLAALSALRIGAGLSSVASPMEAVAINASQLTSVMVKPFSGVEGLSVLLEDTRFNAVVIGPGCGPSAATRDLVEAVLKSPARVVLDADGLSAFQKDPAALFRWLRPGVVMTPHAGEFERIFPGLLESAKTRIDAARSAAAKTGVVVLLKGPDTVIAAPDGAAAVTTNAPPTLATAGSGDALAGMIAGLLAQHMAPFAAATAGAWLHGAAARAFGPGLIAEDLPGVLPAALRTLFEGGAV